VQVTHTLPQVDATTTRRLNSRAEVWF
jgi:hypothetical protein